MAGSSPKLLLLADSGHGASREVGKMMRGRRGFGFAPYPRRRGDVVVGQREVGRQRLRAHPWCAMAKEGRSRGRIWVRQGLGVALGSFI
jgi:hypothetical protein